MNILQFADGFKRLICRDEMATALMPNNVDGLSKITNLNYNVYDDTHMIDVFTFDSYLSHNQLRFEEETLDKLTTIRVSPVSAVRNIKELSNKYTIDMNKNIIPINNNAPVKYSQWIPQFPNMMRRPVESKMNRPAPAPAPGPTPAPGPVPVPALHSHRRFGMRGLFM
jgi:hypothetical protein